MKQLLRNTVTAEFVVLGRFWEYKIKRTYLENTLVWYSKPTLQSNQKKSFDKCAIGYFQTRSSIDVDFNQLTHNKESSCKTHDGSNGPVRDKPFNLLC